MFNLMLKVWRLLRESLVLSAQYKAKDYGVPI